MTLNEKIKNALKLSGKTQKGLAEAIGVSTSTLNNWLKLGRDIPAQYIIPICEYIGTSVDYMLYGDGEAPHSPAALKEDELCLLMFYQDYKNGTDYSGCKLEDFFPDLLLTGQETKKAPTLEISENGHQMLELFEQLSDHEQVLLIGRLQEMTAPLLKKRPSTDGQAV